MDDYKAYQVIRIRVGKTLLKEGKSDKLYCRGIKRYWLSTTQSVAFADRGYTRAVIVTPYLKQACALISGKVEHYLALTDPPQTTSMRENQQAEPTQTHTLHST